MLKRFQFSLRGLLVALTITCLWLGWKIEGARRRGAAIDAISAIGGKVFYDSALADPSIGSQQDHFWEDAKCLPVWIILPVGLDPDVVVARYLKQAAPVETLTIYQAIRDDTLEQLCGLNDGCVIRLDPQHLSPEAIAEFRRKRPQLTVSEF